MKNIVVHCEGCVVGWLEFGGTEMEMAGVNGDGR